MHYVNDGAFIFTPTSWPRHISSCSNDVFCGQHSYGVALQKKKKKKKKKKKNQRKENFIRLPQQFLMPRVKNENNVVSDRV